MNEKIISTEYPGRVMFFGQYGFPVHPKYAMDIIDKKVKEIMKKRYGNPNDQTMLHVQIDCCRFAQDQPNSEKLQMYQNWFCLSLIKAGTNLYALDKKGNTAM